MQSYDVTLSELGSIPLAVVRRRAGGAELARVVPECCGTVWNFLRAQGLRGGRNVAVYLDAAIHLEVGVEMEGAFQESAEVIRSGTPAGLVLTTTYFGQYTQLGPAHRAITEWAKQHHQQLAGPSWEVYGHWQEEWNSDPSRIRTDIFYQVTPSATTAG
ncbi:MAG: GyrI-like domain-containing protein [Gemmatimonadota bacterium]